MPQFLIRFRHLLFVATLLSAIVCGILIPRVSINTDMTKYLPEDSHMKAGMTLLNNEFDLEAEMHGAAVRIMAANLSDEEKVDLRLKLRQTHDVKSVNVLENDTLTLFELEVPSPVDQLQMKRELKRKYSNIQVIETSQDGTTLRLSLLLSAMALLLVILFAMCPSWLEPILFLASTGIAVILNMGTNALLPHVSSTTNSIAGVLQLVLSMDYSIILINRFRQERPNHEDSASAMMQAIHRAFPSVLSSAFTTAVGLMMLCFMNIKIGSDIGIVLSKGVVFSLICNFTVLPTLIIMFEKGINASKKRTLSIPTNRLSNFTLRHRVPLAALFLIIFFGSWYFSTKTPIIFRNQKMSEIDPYLSKKNPLVLVYDNADEGRVANLLDSLMADPNVEMATSYPSLMIREYTAPQMVFAAQDMTRMLTSTSPNNRSIKNLDMLNDDVLRLIYYAAKSKEDSLSLSFAEFAGFILAQSKDPNSIIAANMGDGMKGYMGMIEDLLSLSSDEFEEEAGTTPTEPYTFEPTEPTSREIADNPQPAIEPEPAAQELPTYEPSEALRQIIDQPQAEPILAVSKTSYSPYTDTNLLHRMMNSAEMSAYFGVGENLIKIAFRMAKRKKAEMTPLEFAHFVTEDLFKRNIANRISPEQKAQIYAVQATMDSAEYASKHPNAVPPIGLQPKEVAVLPKVDLGYPEKVETTDTTKAESLEENAESVIKTASAPQNIYHAPKAPSTPIDDVDPLEMLTSNKRYTAEEMAANINGLIEGVSDQGSKIPGIIHLAYKYYGGQKCYNPEWTMSVGQIVNFIADSVIDDPRYSAIVSDTIHNVFDHLQDALHNGIDKLHAKNHSVALIVTGYPIEAPETHTFLKRYSKLCDSHLDHEYYSIGESVMISEMRSGFSHEMLLVTLLTIFTIFIIVALTFRSILVAAILVMAVMSGVFVNVAASGIGGGSIMYLVYLIVQSILMGAAIDYGILFTNYYRERRQRQDIRTALRKSYKGTINTILTSGLILILVPGAMGFLEQDPSIRAIGRSISIGALATVLIILFVLPGLIATCDRFIVKRHHTGKRRQRRLERRQQKALMRAQRNK